MTTDVKLVMNPGSGGSRTFRLRHAETVVGRRRDCGVRVVSSDVSRRHCLLSFQDGYLTVQDLDSINGTFLNGQRVTGRQVVRPGDRLEVGPAVFLAEYELSQDAMSRIEQLAASGADDEVIEADLVTEGVPKPHQVKTAEDADAPLPVEDHLSDPEVFKLGDMDEAQSWQLPEPDELHDLLAHMDDPKPGERRRKR